MSERSIQIWKQTATRRAAEVAMEKGRKVSKTGKVTYPKFTKEMKEQLKAVGVEPNAFEKVIRAKLPTEATTYNTFGINRVVYAKVPSESAPKNAPESESTDLGNSGE